MNNYMYLVPVAAVIALLFAAYLAAKVSRQDAGTERMKEIAGAIADGARAFLTAEYKILIVFVVVLFVLIGLGVGNWVTAVCFVVGALFSTIAGYCGMTVATKANVRTANAAKESGMNKALSIAFSGGAVMGMCVAGLGALGVSLVYIVTKNVDVLFGFSLGASSIALFARVGGGIYTKAADVGADLVGKVEAGIPEDDPRNPAVIADNVGDNVGDVAGMGADLFESYCGSLISALTLGVAVSEVSGVLFPLAIAGCGLIASILGTFFVRGGENTNPQKALTKGSYASSAIVIIASLALSWVLFGNMPAAPAPPFTATRASDVSNAGAPHTISLGHWIPTLPARPNPGVEAVPTSASIMPIAATNGRPWKACMFTSGRTTSENVSEASPALHAHQPADTPSRPTSRAASSSVPAATAFISIIYIRPNSPTI